MDSKFRLALIQLAVSASKPDNLANAALKIKEAAEMGAQVVALPECFNSPYGNSYFQEYAENIPGNSTDVLSKVAKENNIFLIGDFNEVKEFDSITAKLVFNLFFIITGSIPESQNGKLFNTCPIFNPAGEIIATHRKVHLAVIDIPGKIQSEESETLSPGSKLTSFDTPFCKIGIGICYDIRFAEMAQIYAQNGCKLLIYPSVFNMITGPAHWELLQRGRAIDNQLYVAGICSARCETSSYIAWGHSTVISPWGDVVSTTEYAEDIVYADIDTGYVDEIRKQIPLEQQKRKDLYEIVNRSLS